MNKTTKLCLLIVGLLILLGTSSCTQEEEICPSKIILHTTGLWRKTTYVVCADGSGEIKYKIPRGLGDHPDWSPDGEWVVYDRHLSFPTRTQLVLYNLTNKKTTIIQEMDADGSFSPSWSPSGKEIIFEEAGGIFIIDMSCIYTSGECAFSPVYITNGFSPSWSYDGKRIVIYVHGDKSGSTRLQVVEVQNPKNKTDITPPNVLVCMEPDWSRVENKIIGRCSLDIYLFDMDSGEVTNLTEGSAAIEAIPKWSPDGNRIAFISDRDEDLGTCLHPECTVTAMGLYVMDKDGSNIIRLTINSEEDIIWYSWIP